MDFPCEPNIYATLSTSELRVRLVQELSTAKTYEHNLFDEWSALIGIDGIWLLSLMFPTVYQLNS